MHKAKLKITILVDNQAGDDLTPEHGFSLWIDTGAVRIVFDTGQGPALAANAAKLGIDLEQTDILALSHGHYDHTGGIPHVLQASRKAKLCCHAGVVQPRYAMRNGTTKSIRMPGTSMRAIDKMAEENLQWVSRARPIAKDIGLTGPIPRETSYEDTGGPFYLDPHGNRADPVEDDLALWIRTARGLIVCVGCCHAGIVNTLNHVFRLSGSNRLHALIGGFHLMNACSERLERTMTALRSFSPETVIPCHCTGERGMKMLYDALGDKVVPGLSGVCHTF